MSRRRVGRLHDEMAGAMIGNCCSHCGLVHLGECYGIFQQLHDRLDTRQVKGLETYLESIDESPLDGLEEALDECLDLAVYLMKAILQRDRERSAEHDKT